MAAYTSGSDWTFPNDLPGSWSQADVDAQLHAEGHTTREPGQQSKPSEIQHNTQHPEGEDPRRRQHWSPRTCRICLEVVLPTFHMEETSLPVPDAMRPALRAAYESPAGDGGRLIRPCKCKGSQKYVHEECLAAWRKQDPLQERNYFECPTCRYQYKLARLSWGSYISCKTSQIGLTLAIFLSAMFVLGFVADPIINLYVDPISTITTAGGPTGTIFFEEPTWTEHFLKGMASLGLLGFAKFLLTLSPWQWFNIRNSGVVVGRGGTGRERVQGISWVAVVIGIATVLWALWKGVRAWSRRVLENCGEGVQDVPLSDDDDDDD
ncbi:RING-variant domain is a C4HC3 zinc-finger like motif [Teratosphaeria destructans]|uniref:RING-variant domain is a C4HC3 zinc-finger like motif n=1 Tax=Teratosphaeria destructans TaxID=418781 RepID=A0A9W7W294_9PEZI|nr:RING-variant domain is a C4HC3 zinc-finger like motif [Teratosphaeria destructans]